MFFRLLVLTSIFTALNLSAQDYGPVKVDLEEYVDDSKLEVVEDETKNDSTTGKPDPKTQKDPKKDNSNDRIKRPRTDTNTKTSKPRKVIKPMALPKLTKSSDNMMYIYIGAGVLVVVVVIVVIAMKKKSSPGSKKVKPLMADMDDDEVTQQTVTTAEGIKTSYDVQEKFQEETRIDSRGRNPSGIIIDEDMYFSKKSAGNFIDEDLEGGEGPDVSGID